MKRKKLIILIVIIIIIIILIPSVFFFIVCKDAEKSDLRLKIYSNKNEYDINTSSIKIDIELKNIGNCPIYIEKIFSFSLNLNLDITTPNGILLEHIHEVLTYVPKKDILFPNDIKKETINLKSRESKNMNGSINSFMTAINEIGRGFF